MLFLTWIKGRGLDASSTQYRRIDGALVNSGAISTFMEYGVISQNRLVPRYVELYLSGKLKIDDLITSCFCLNDINSALEVFKSGRNVIRVLIENNLF